MQIYRVTSGWFPVDSCVAFNARKTPAQEIVCSVLLNLILWAVFKAKNIVTKMFCFLFRESIVIHRWVVKFKFRLVTPLGNASVGNMLISLLFRNNDRGIYICKSFTVYCVYYHCSINSITSNVAVYNSVVQVFYISYQKSLKIF